MTCLGQKTHRQHLLPGVPKRRWWRDRSKLDPMSSTQYGVLPFEVPVRCSGRLDLQEALRGSVTAPNKGDPRHGADLRYDGGDSRLLVLCCKLHGATYVNRLRARSLAPAEKRKDSFLCNVLSASHIVSVCAGSDVKTAPNREVRQIRIDMPAAQKFPFKEMLKHQVAVLHHNNQSSHTVARKQTTAEVFTDFCMTKRSLPVAESHSSL